MTCVEDGLVRTLRDGASWAQLPGPGRGFLPPDPEAIWLRPIVPVGDWDGDGLVDVVVGAPSTCLAAPEVCDPPCSGDEECEWLQRFIPRAGRLYVYSLADCAAP